MAEAANNEEVVRLGTGFAFEPRIPRLSRDGSVLKLQRVPLQALAVLIEHKGQIVSRDHLAERIWGKGVSLDADNSLNVAIRKLRQALGDNPEEPRYIQTITGQGYRLIASAVHEEPPAAADLAAADVASVSIPVTPSAAVPSSGIAKPRRWPLYAAVLALAVLCGGGWVYWAHVHKIPARPARSMIAVLPFENLTGDKGQDYFSDGLTEEMITQVGNLDPQRLGVIGRTSVMYYKSHPQTLLQLGHDLGVQYVVEGSVRRHQEQARIAVRLLRVSDGAMVWTNSFDRSIGDALSLQSEIAQRIGTTLQTQVLGRGFHHPTNPEVVEAYLRGRFELNRTDNRDRRHATTSSARLHSILRTRQAMPVWPTSTFFARCGMTKDRSRPGGWLSRTRPKLFLWTTKRGSACGHRAHPAHARLGLAAAHGNTPCAPCS